MNSMYLKYRLERGERAREAQMEREFAARNAPCPAIEQVQVQQMGEEAQQVPCPTCGAYMECTHRIQQMGSEATTQTDARQRAEYLNTVYIRKRCDCPLP